MNDLWSGIALLVAGSLLAVVGWAARRWVTAVERALERQTATHRRASRSVCRRLRSLQRTTEAHERRIEELVGHVQTLPCAEALTRRCPPHGGGPPGSTPPTPTRRE